jgi:hypothetical protein
MEPLFIITVPPLNVQLVQLTFELTVRTTPGLRLKIQLVQLLIAGKAEVLTLAVIGYVVVCALTACEKATSKSTATRRVDKGLIGKLGLSF